MKSSPAKASGFVSLPKQAIADEATRHSVLLRIFSFAFNLEIAIIVGSLFNVLFNDTIGNITTAAAKISTCPKMSPQYWRRKLVNVFCNVCELLPFIFCANRLIVTCGGTETKRWTWSRAIYPRIISTLRDVHIWRMISRVLRAIPPTKRVPMLGYPYDVQMDRKNAVCVVLVVFHTHEHTTTRLKPPAKAGGLPLPVADNKLLK